MTTLKIEVADIQEVADMLRKEKVWHMPFRYNLGHYEVTLKDNNPTVSMLVLKYTS